MNVQEAIKTIEKMGEYEHFVDEPISKKSVLNIVNQIDEPQKVKIPKFVAEWFSKNPINGWWRKIAQWEQVVPLEDKEVYEWYSNYNETKFMQAWIAFPNVEVEKEKLFVVELPSGNSRYKLLLYKGPNDEKPYFTLAETIGPNHQLPAREIKKHYEWSWRYAKLVEEKG